MNKLPIFLLISLALTVCACAEDDSSQNTPTPGTETTPDDNSPANPDDNSPANPDDNTSNPTNPEDTDSSSGDVLNLFGKLTDEQKKTVPLTPLKTLNDMGLYPSDMDLYGDYAYVVDSGNNTIHRIKLDDLSVEKNYVDLGLDASPYAAFADKDALYVAAQGKQAVYKYPHDNPGNFSVVASGLVAPTAVYTKNGSIYIADSEYDYANPTQTGGKVHVISDTQDAFTLTSTSQNPGFLDHCPMFNWIFSVNSGVITFGQTMLAPEKSCVDVWEIASLSGDKENTPIRTYCLENTSLGRTIKSNVVLYIGDALKPVIHALDIKSINAGTAEFKTITLSNDDTGMTTPVDVENHLAVLEFNHDTITWFEDEKQTTYRLSSSKAAAKGPIDAVYDATRKQLLILNSTSGSVDVLKFSK